MLRSLGGRRAGFTLMELLVVTGIILIMTALSIPAISKFLDGQSLAQSGRILQSSFNEARRAAITQRTKNYLLFFRDDDPQRPGQYVYGVIRYREGHDFEGKRQLLLPSVQFDMIPPYGSDDADLIVGRLRGIKLPVFKGVPKSTDTSVFVDKKVVDALGWIEFRKDGTLGRLGNSGEPKVCDEKLAPTVSGDSIFDLNVPFDAVNDNLAEQVDINIREESDVAEVDKRCFIDIDINTGRATFRVLKCSESGAGADSIPPP